MSGLFSEREGYVTQYIQYEFINESLRKKIYLWLIYYLLEKSQVHSKANLETIYIHFFDLVPMEYPDSPEDFLLKFCLHGIWHRLYSLIEFIYSRMGATEKELKHEMDTNINLILERNRSAYRLIDGKISAIINKEEVDEIEKAVEETMPSATHIKRALELLSDKTVPDYRNSIKESISAVEAVCILITGDSSVTLGKALNMLKADARLRMSHPALLDAYSKLYGFAGDEGGIRHALDDKSIEVSMEDARYMLVSCSAFVNYLTEKARKAGILN